jgi:protein TonB
MQNRTLNLGPNRRLVTITGVVVVGLHLALLLLWLFNGHIKDVPKRPDIDIELTAPAPVQSEIQAPPAPVTPPAPALQPPPEVPVTPKPPPPQPSDTAPVVPSEPTPTPPPAAAAPAPTGGQADVLPSALTADADYKAAELNNPKPLYPLTAVRQEAQGRVLLLVEVLADGRAGRVTLEKTSGHAILDASAMNTVRLWQFIPARKDGVFVTQTIRVPIDFNLKDSR